MLIQLLGLQATPPCRVLMQRGGQAATLHELRPQKQPIVQGTHYMRLASTAAQQPALCLWRKAVPGPPAKRPSHNIGACPPSLGWHQCVALEVRWFGSGGDLHLVRHRAGLLSIQENGVRLRTEWPLAVLIRQHERLGRPGGQRLRLPLKPARRMPGALGPGPAATGAPQMVVSHCFRQQRAAAMVSAALVRVTGLAPALVDMAPRQADPAVRLPQLGQLLLHTHPTMRSTLHGMHIGPSITQMLGDDVSSMLAHA